MTPEIDKNLIISCVDHTSLNVTDTASFIASFTEKAMDGEILPAAICVYPSMVETVGLTLGESPITVAAVCGAFPSGQTYMEVKLLEVAMAIENGAEEIDVVCNVGKALEGDLDTVKAEITAIKEEIADEALLKVILETGLLETPEQIYQTAMAAMEAGADFIKTSTGKTPVGATEEAVRTMCRAAKAFYEQTGEKIGIKCSGGISDLQTAQKYVNIVREELGEQWLNPKFFRIGSSKLL